LQRSPLRYVCACSGASGDGGRHELAAVGWPTRWGGLPLTMKGAYAFVLTLVSFLLSFVRIQCVEDLRREGGRKRVRVNRHRPAKRSRPSVEKTLFTTTDFPSLSAGDSVLEDVVPPTTAPTAEPANAEVISTGVAAPSSVKSAPASLDFVRALVYGRKRKPLPTPPRAAAVLRVPSARAFRFARRAANSRPVAFAPKKIAPVKSSVIPMLAISEKQRYRFLVKKSGQRMFLVFELILFFISFYRTTDSVQTASVKNIMGPQPSVRPLVDLCRDKRRRITSLRNR
jgi:hypothetical protein